LTVIRRCLFRDPDETTPSILTYERTLSVTVYRTSFTFYSCMGSKHHNPHLMRIEYGQIVKNETTKKPKLITKQTNPIPLEKRERLFAKEIMYCPIGKCKMKTQKVLTQTLNDPTQEVFHCPGSAKANHNGHYLKVCHGFLDGGFPQITSSEGKIGILIVTIDNN